MCPAAQQPPLRPEAVPWWRCVEGALARAGRQGESVQRGRMKVRPFWCTTPDWCTLRSRGVFLPFHPVPLFSAFPAGAGWNGVEPRVPAKAPWCTTPAFRGTHSFSSLAHQLMCIGLVSLIITMKCSARDVSGDMVQPAQPALARCHGPCILCLALIIGPHCCTASGPSLVRCHRVLQSLHTGIACSAPGAECMRSL